MGNVYTPKEVKELKEARRQEMSFMLPNQFTFCFGERIPSKTITIKEKIQWQRITTQQQATIQQQS